MKIDFVPLSTALVPACRDFNQRLLAASEPLFLLPETVPDEQAGAIIRRNYVAVDQTGAVRGGVLVMDQPGWLREQPVRLVNIQSPLTEGIIGRRFSGVGLQMLKFLATFTPYLYAVGMGSEQNPFARLLAAAGWQVARVPFQFSVIRAGPFLRELRAFQRGSKRVAARAAALSGLPQAATMLWNAAHRRPVSRAYSLEPTSQTWAGVDSVWERCRSMLSVSVLRDQSGLASLYPDCEPRLKRFLLRRGGEVVGWSAGLVTPMQSSPHFGNLTVGTILDGLAEPAHLPALFSLTRDALADQGVELVVTNQTHTMLREHLRRLGFLSTESNYMLALSKPLAKALREFPGAFDRMHVTRGDGDGRIHL